MSELLEAELARAVVARIASQELPLFAAVSESWRKRRALPPQSGNELLGFGLSEGVALLTPIVLACSEQVAQYLAVDLGKSAAHSAAKAVGGRIARLFRREPQAEPLSAAQLARITRISTDVALSGGLSEAQASLVANAIAGLLAQGTTAS